MGILEFNRKDGFILFFERSKRGERSQEAVLDKLDAGARLVALLFARTK